MLVGLADGQLLSYRTGAMTPRGGGSGSGLELAYTVRVGASPVELTLVAQGAKPGEPGALLRRLSFDFLLNLSRLINSLCLSIDFVPVLYPVLYPIRVCLRVQLAGSGHHGRE